MAQATASTVKQEREEVYLALQYAASFSLFGGKWKECEELEPKPKEMWTFVNKKGEAKQVSVYEMRKE